MSSHHLSNEILLEPQSWSIVIFGYNEESTIGLVIKEVYDFLLKHNIEKFEIIVVDDGSNDSTEIIVNKIASVNERIKIIRHCTNLGIGPAMISGYKSAMCENIVALPADGQFNIYELSEFLTFHNKSFVSFYREKYSMYTPYRYLITSANKLFNKYFLGVTIRDVNWVKVYKTSDIRNINLRLKSSLVGSEICAKLLINGNSVIEVPSHCRNRIGGKSRGASIKTISKAIFEMLKLAIIVTNFKKNVLANKNKAKKSMEIC